METKYHEEDPGMARAELLDWCCGKIEMEKGLSTSAVSLRLSSLERNVRRKNQTRLRITLTGFVIKDQ